MTLRSRWLAGLLIALATSQLIACGGGSGAGSGSVTSAGSATGTSNSAVLTWDPPTAPNVTGYRVYYGTSPGAYLQSPGQGLSVGNVTTYTLMGLSSRTRFYFAVTAIDTVGNESGFSNEVSKDIP